MTEIPEIVMAPGERRRGFVVERATPVPEIGAVAYRLRHAASGARLLHLHCADDENLFSINFPTPPPDDTGLPHILEHAVLAGSRRYPVREPMFEMIRMSMATFINAMTGKDCTYYPVASNVRRDLFNLAEVYFDAAFHPLLTDETLQREGHHLAPESGEDPQGALTINGIVYNEMKGAFSNPEERLARLATNALFPTTAYGRESGGDPEAIPDLTLERIREFHDRFYHPSNAYFFAYGDIPTDEHLAFLAPRLAGYERREPALALEREPRWSRPQSLHDTYAVAEDEATDQRTYLQIQWLAGDALDPMDAVLMRVLSLLLLGHEGAPLKRAIIGSRLGADIFAAGEDPIGPELLFQIGLRGSEADRAEAFRELVTDTLAEIAADPPDREAVAAAFRQAAFDLLEIESMQPLHRMMEALAPWIHGADPLLYLRTGGYLEAGWRRYEAEPDLFGRLIRERLLENPHRLETVLEPDRQWEARAAERRRARLARMEASLDENERRAIAEQSERIERSASEPNPPEAVAQLPQLAIGDLPREVRTIPGERTEAGGIPVCRNEVAANGISYLTLELDIRDLPAHLWPEVPRFVEGIRKLGAAGHDYAAMGRRIAAHTGGIEAGLQLRSHARDPETPLWGIQVSMKALDEQIEPALDVLGDLLFGLDPRDRGRLGEVLEQARARKRSSLVQEGSRTASRRAARGLTPEGHLAELVGGRAQLERVAGWLEDFDAAHTELMSRIEALRDHLLARGRWHASFTGGDAAWRAVDRRLRSWSEALRDEAPGPADPAGFAPGAAPRREGLAASLQVAHAATVLPAPHQSHPDQPLIAAGAHLLSLDHMLPEVRLKGGAYGAWFRYDGLGRRFAFGSYQDPNVARTLAVFEEARAAVSRAGWTEADVERAVIATAKREHKPLRPAEATDLALDRARTGQDAELRQAQYEGLLAATPEKVTRALAEALEGGAPHAATCVVAGRDALEAANAELATPLEIEPLLPQAAEAAGEEAG